MPTPFRCPAIPSPMPRCATSAAAGRRRSTSPTSSTRRYFSTCYPGGMLLRRRPEHPGHAYREFLTAPLRRRQDVETGTFERLSRHGMTGTNHFGPATRGQRGCRAQETVAACWHPRRELGTRWAISPANEGDARERRSSLATAPDTSLGAPWPMLPSKQWASIERICRPR